MQLQHKISAEKLTKSITVRYVELQKGLIYTESNFKKLVC